MIQAPTPHNDAKVGDIADTVLMPGDPLRAKYIAEKYLDNVVCFNELRGMLGFTGEYNGKRISIMGSGMGMPSIGIYSYELYKFYGVEKIIRIGSCGAYDDNLELLDTIIVDKAYSESNFALTFRNSHEHIIDASKELTKNVLDIASKLNKKVVVGTILTSDCFDWYIDIKKVLERLPSNIKCIGAEMEAYALFNVAKELNKQAACILTVVDSHTKKTSVSADDRQVALNDMIEIALKTAISY
jgi:purine-nucleoside phosphorylase